MTSLIRGGNWHDNVAAGIMYRDLGDSPSTTWDTVASKCRHLKNSQIIRMVMVSTKMQGLLLITADGGSMEPMQVSHIDVWTIVHSLHSVMSLQ